MKNFKLLLSAALFAAIFSACLRDEVDVTTQYYYPEELTLLQSSLNLPAEPLNYNVELPSHLVRSGLFARNINKDMATLGRVLFYDKALSSTGTVSCASCHKQNLAFADEKAQSDGVNGNRTDRNSLALGSVASFAAYYGSDLFGSFGVPFMWDNRFGTAKDQAKAAFTSQKEMGMNMAQIIETVQNQPYYAPLFRRAYGDGNVNEDRVLSAVAEFIDGLSTFGSKFDEQASKSGNGFDMDVNFSGFTAAENRGKSLYMDNCASCHSNVFGRPVLNMANNGLDADYTDRGVGGATNNNAENYMFKVPTLRNIALTAPYMHDGRFESLEDVVEFYSSGVKSHPQLHNDLRDFNGNPKRLNLTEEQKNDLVAFLHTLTDHNYLTAERFSDPFK